VEPIATPVDSTIWAALMGPMGGAFGAGILVGVVIGWNACSYVFTKYRMRAMREEIEELKEELNREREERKKLAEEIREIHRMLMKS